MRDYSTVLWIENGYQIASQWRDLSYGKGALARFIHPNGKDFTSKFIQFAEDFLTNKKGDSQHKPTINSCLVRILVTINSKCGRVVKII